MAHRHGDTDFDLVDYGNWLRRPHEGRSELIVRCVVHGPSAVASASANAAGPRATRDRVRTVAHSDRRAGRTHEGGPFSALPSTDETGALHPSQHAPDVVVAAAVHGHEALDERRFHQWPPAPTNRWPRHPHFGPPPCAAPRNGSRPTTMCPKKPESSRHLISTAFRSTGRPIDSTRCSFRLGSFGASRRRADAISPPATPRDPLHDVGRVPSGTDDQHRGERVEKRDTQEVEAGGSSRPRRETPSASRPRR